MVVNLHCIKLLDAFFDHFVGADPDRSFDWDCQGTRIDDCSIRPFLTFG